MDHEELENLLARCALRDQKALELLYQQMSSYLNGVAYRILGTADQADDVLQEGFIQIWDNAASYSASKANPVTWMTSIIRYRAIDKLRVENRHQNRPHPDEEEDVLQTIPGEETGESQYLQFRLNQQLQRCLDLMNAKFKKCMELAYLYGYSREELADNLDANVNTIKSWLHRGSKSLKQCMEAEQEGLGDE